MRGFVIGMVSILLVFGGVGIINLSSNDRAQSSTFSGGQVAGVSDLPGDNLPTYNKVRISRAQVLSESLTLNQKISQRFIFSLTKEEVSTGSAKVIEAIQPGGILLLGDYTIEELSDTVTWINGIDFAIPPFIAIDQEGGPVKRLRDDPHPGADTLGPLPVIETCKAFAYTTGLLAQTGVSMNLGIVADVGRYEDGYITNRTFGSSPQDVSEHVLEAIRCSGDIITVIKHFPGHGVTPEDSHKTLPQTDISMSELIETDIPPFTAAIEAGTDAIMTGHLVYPLIEPDLPASLSGKYVSTLRDMGFEGLILTDDLSMLTASGMDLSIAIDYALFAGNDIILISVSPEDAEDLIGGVLRKAANSGYDQSQTDESVYRILDMKIKYGLL